MEEASATKVNNYKRSLHMNRKCGEQFTRDFSVAVAFHDDFTSLICLGQTFSFVLRRVFNSHGRSPLHKVCREPLRSSSNSQGMLSCVRPHSRLAAELEKCLIVIGQPAS